MCGIAGIFFFNDFARSKPNGMVQALERLHLRGPDSRGTYAEGNVCLGHTRLSIIDTTAAANQPFSDPSGRYTLVFNGEIYNFRALKEQLKQKNINFRSESDTEVLLFWLIEKGADGLKDLNGFFSFGFYDRQEETLLVARDRYGIKPLFFHQNGEKFLFASEMKALLAMGIPKIIDKASLSAYLHLNYIPGPWTIFDNVFKLMSGHYIKLSHKGIEEKEYYTLLPNPLDPEKISYDKAKQTLREKLAVAVRKRLVADVPLGAFLSGGIDSSIITALAAKEVKGLNTFSIGFRDEPLFDETHYARAVAKMHGTNHTEFRLTTDDLLGSIFEVLDYTDEPFADSSALAVYILSRETRKKVTVALSGDGADELFAGYNKHRAEWKTLNPSLPEKMLLPLHPLLSRLPQSRNSFLLNKFRQLNRFTSGMKLPATERYWQWAGFTRTVEVSKIFLMEGDTTILEKRKEQWLKNLSQGGTITGVLQTDTQLVLPYDMLTKVDMMSMANSLEVRVPFLDHEFVDFVFSLPEAYKIDRNARKKILREAFRDELPPELFNRNKQGFEVPLLRWFRNELKSLIEDDLLAEPLIIEQGIFNLQEVQRLIQQLNSRNPGDAPARLWGLLVFQYWWKKNMI
ncbi:MAG: asparagine synthase (glutamine-hydrolyzing) [Bacteroides sp.]|nr:asparagine synthase (glutamine-hydrolyzing) [Bacteroides sp.]